MSDREPYRVGDRQNGVLSLLFHRWHLFAIAGASHVKRLLLGKLFLQLLVPLQQHVPEIRDGHSAVRDSNHPGEKIQLRLQVFLYAGPSFFIAIFFLRLHVLLS